jgi:hypothetical protein
LSMLSDSLDKFKNQYSELGESTILQ